MSTECLQQRCGILVIDDDETLASTLSEFLRQRYPCVHTALSGEEALALLAREDNICLVLADLVMPLMDGLSLLEQVRHSHPGTSVILMTGFGTIETAVQAIKQGAEDYLTKPFDPETVLKKVSRLMELYELKERVAQLEGRLENRSPFAAIVAGSAVMQDALDRAAVAARSSAPLLLVGETGTGKEMLARAIHRASQRASGPFLPINCAALPHELVESELFGHRKGAFTGALTDHSGLFQAADGGTLFLDEIAEMPPAIQAKLLRVLEEGEVRPVGETTVRRVDVRLISASNRPLSALRRAALRDDLFFRVSTIVIELPPLRHRREDLCLLTKHYLDEYARRYGRRLSLATAGLSRLLDYPFPGNVRELAHILESIVAVSTEDPQVITEHDLDRLLRFSGASPDDLSTGLLVNCSLQAVEKIAIRQALRLAGHNKSQAAQLLGLSRASLYRKLKDHGLDTGVESSSSTLRP